MSTLAATQLETAKGFIAGCNEWTANGVMRNRSDDCIHALLPVSLGRPPLTNAEFKLFFGNMEETITNFKLTTHKIVNDAEQHMAVVHCSGSGDAPFAPYKNEYAFFLKFNDEGTEIIRIEEFVDSKFGTEFMEKMHAWAQTQK